MLMKKITLLVLFLLAGFSSMAQVEIGLMVSPTISSPRFIAEDRHGFENEGSKLGLGVGVVADYFFAQNYAFSTGVIYRSKGGEISYIHPSVDFGNPRRLQDDISLQYIELPISLKLFTNEVAPGTILYFQVGGSLNTKVSANVNGEKVINGEKVSKRFSIFEADAILGGGAEFQMGESTKIFAGLTYHRGLSNIDDYYRDSLDDKNIGIKNNGFSLDVGIKF